jgi:hypothetical protein
MEKNLESLAETPKNEPGRLTPSSQEGLQAIAQPAPLSQDHDWPVKSLVTNTTLTLKKPTNHPCFS